MFKIVLGAFFGDEAKGQCVNNLVDESSIVVRFSGANQVGHNVQHNGISHCFRNFGSGTLKGVPTYWSEYCVANLTTMYSEFLELQALGVEPKIIFSPLCELVTPFDVAAQWGNAKNREHGTVGTGFKAVLDRVAAGYSLTIADARHPLVLREKIYNMMDYYFKTGECSLVPNLDKWISDTYNIAKNLIVKNLDYLNTYSTIVFEGSQGILLDQKHGVLPFCTPSNTTSKNAMEIIKRLNRVDSVYTYYVCRPYITRHGPGPLLTTTKILDILDHNNLWNEYQKSFRACEFDVKLLKHILEIDKCYNNEPNKFICFSHGEECQSDLLQQLKGYQVKAFEFEKWLL